VLVVASFVGVVVAFMAASAFLVLNFLVFAFLAVVVPVVFVTTFGVFRMLVIIMRGMIVIVLSAGAGVDAGGEDERE
jgi:hypothetical protein